MEVGTLSRARRDKCIKTQEVHKYFLITLPLLKNIILQLQPTIGVAIIII